MTRNFCRGGDIGLKTVANNDLLHKATTEVMLDIERQPIQ